jgi:hypothetical protein
MTKYKVTLTILSSDPPDVVKATCDELLDPLSTPENITVETVVVEEIPTNVI